MKESTIVNDCFLSGLVGCFSLTVASFGIVLAMENEFSSLHASYFGWDEEK